MSTGLLHSRHSPISRPNPIPPRVPSCGPPHQPNMSGLRQAHPTREGAISISSPGAGVHGSVLGGPPAAVSCAAYTNLQISMMLAIPEARARGKNHSGDSGQASFRTTPVEGKLPMEVEAASGRVRHAAPSALITHDSACRLVWEATLPCALPCPAAHAEYLLKPFDQFNCLTSP